MSQSLIVTVEFVMFSPRAFENSIRQNRKVDRWFPRFVKCIPPQPTFGFWAVKTMGAAALPIAVMFVMTVIVTLLADTGHDPQAVDADVPVDADRRHGSCPGTGDDSRGDMCSAGCCTVLRCSRTEADGSEEGERDRDSDCCVHAAPFWEVGGNERVALGECVCAPAKPQRIVVYLFGELCFKSAACSFDTVADGLDG